MGSATSGASSAGVRTRTANASVRSPAFASRSCSASISARIPAMSTNSPGAASARVQRASTTSGPPLTTSTRDRCPRQGIQCAVAMNL